MTANQEQIQRLLTEVQTVLAESNARLPWGLAAQNARQRQILEQIRSHFQAALQVNSAGSSQTEIQAQTVMQGVIDEMNALRSTLLRPLHSEVATLMQQRTALAREVRQLEAHRQLLQQPAPMSSASQSAQSVEKMQVVHDRADQVLTTLDTTLHVVFESLQKDIQSYQDSLSQGIDNLHTLGQQSEVMFSGMVGRLATQMGRDAANFLQDSGQTSPPAQAALAMPYAGTELPPMRREAQSSAIETITVLTQLIDQLETDVKESPIAIPIKPPQNGSSNGQPTSDLRALFEPESLNTDAIEPFASRDLAQEMSLDQLSAATRSAHSISNEEATIFTLEGIEDLFLDESDSQPNE